VEVGVGEGRRGPGQLESEVLAVLWAADAALTPAQIQAELGGKLAYNTVHTILGRLCDKGQIVRALHDGRPAYAPAKEAAEDSADRMRAVLDAGRDRQAILARFVTGLDAEDEAALRAFLRRRRRTP
jgi:predicted transcriptional regulator